jgi:branched-chain amino acid transport system permease protein
LLFILVSAGLFGFGVERAFFRSLRGKWLQLVVASVGISLILQSLGWIAFGVQEKNVASAFPGVFEFIGVRLPKERVLAAAVAVILVALLYVLVYHTKAGLAMRAIEEDEETARMLGINADRVASWAVSIGFALAALAGAFVAPIYSLNPGMGLEVILMSFLIIILGGLGSVAGTVLAGLLVGVLQSIGGIMIGAEATYALVFAAMIVVLIVRPAGLLGRT